MKYIYYVTAYENKGIVGTSKIADYELTRDTPITTMEDVKAVKAQLQQHATLGKVAIAGIFLLRTEGEPTP